MKIFWNLLFFCMYVVGCAQSQREVLTLDREWKFYLGDPEKASLEDFNDQNWQTVDVPHDWSIEGAYSKDNPAGLNGAFLPTGIGWYRKELDYQTNWENKQIFIQFDGVYMNSTVYINGVKLGTRPYGYIGFEYNLTDYLKPGSNIIAVKVDHSKAPSGRWYTGSGIYRHVNLLIVNPIHFKRHGIKIISNLDDEYNGTVITETSLESPASFSSKYFIEQIVVDKNGNQIAIERTNLFNISDKKKVQRLEVTAPDLWSAKIPENRYQLTTKLFDKNNNLIDEVTNTFGFRKIEVSSGKGLLVNGEKTIIKGMCMHHDAGPVGTAVPEDVLRRRLQLLKDMGCNAIRTTHNPFAPEFYRLCNEMGFYVMDEAFDGWEVPKAKYDYGNYFEEWWKKDLSEFIKRDRNHPSVIFWSIGNEVRGFTDKRQHELVEFVKELDDTRFITQGEGSKGTALSIAGMNGHGEFKEAIEKFHEKNPDTPIIGTEITHSYQTRGVYRTQTSYRRRDFPAPWEKGQSFEPMKDKIFLIPDLSEEEVFKDIPISYQSSYDNSIVRMGIRDYWKETKDKTYFLGAFRWTAFDYLGESFGWPARTAPFGIIDLAGFPTDNYYLYQSLWSEKPMIHLLPHWTHPGKEGVEIPVVVYTNMGSAELFLNGKSLGIKKMQKDEFQLVWKVPYKPGELKAVAKPGKGVEISKLYTTAGEPSSIKIKTDRKELSYLDKNIAHLKISILDKNATEVPWANVRLTVSVKGGGKLIGMENGDILDLSSNKSNTHQTFNGKLLALIQPTEEKENIEIQITGQDLKTTYISIKRLP